MNKRNITYYLIFILLTLFSCERNPIKPNDENSENIPWKFARFDGVNSGYYPGPGPENGEIVDTLIYGYPSDMTGPVIDDSGNIYISDYLGVVSKFNKNGKLVWRYDTGHKIDSPGCMLDSVITFGTRENTIIALSRDGNLSWSLETEGRIDHSPISNEHGQAVCTADDGNIYSFDKSGTLLYKFYVGLNLVTKAPSNPAIDSDGNCYLAIRDEVYCLSGNGTLKWHKTYSDYYYRMRGIYIIITPNGTLVFVVEVHDGLYKDEKIVGINTDDGAFLWETSKTGAYYANPLAVDPNGHIYASNSTGGVDVFNEQGKLVSSFIISEEEHPYTAPSLDSDGNIYIGTQFGEKLISLDKKGQINWEIPINSHWIHDIVIYNKKLLFCPRILSGIIVVN